MTPEAPLPPKRDFKRVVAFDTETWLLVPGNVTPPPVCLSFVEASVSEGLKHAPPPQLVSPDTGAELLRGWLACEDTLIIGHRVEYDFGVMAAEYPDLLKPIFETYRNNRVGDTLTRAKLIANSQGMLTRMSGKGSEKNPGRGFSMAAILFRRFGVNRWADKGPDAWRPRYGTLADVPLEEWPEKAVAYAKDDAADTLRIWLDQIFDAGQMQDMFVEAGGHNVATADPLPFVQNESATAAAAWSLHLMSAWGLRTDPIYVARAAQRYEEEISSRDVELAAAGLVKPKRGGGYSRTMAAIREAVVKAHEQAGLVVPLTDKGEELLGSGAGSRRDLQTKYAKTDSDTLISVEHVNPVLKVLRERQEFALSRSKYFEKMLRAGLEHPVTAAWSPLVETGRTACSKPPIQQTPKHHDPIGLRECFVPRPGFLFGAADYSTAELRALAHVTNTLFGFSKMRDALIEGADLHWLFAAWILGVSVEEAQEHPDGELTRQTAKAANFGYPGGMGARTFVYSARKSYRVEIEGGEEGARALKRKWLEAWPEVALYFDFIADACARSGDSFLAVQFGSGRLRGGCGYCDGANTLFQGLVADGAKAALFAVSFECYVDETSPLYGSRPVAFMHDEIVIEAPEDVAPEAADRMSQVMADSMSEFVKSEIPIVVEPAIMRRWYPKADTVRDDEGRLQIWEPDE